MRRVGICLLLVAAFGAQSLATAVDTGRDARDLLPLVDATKSEEGMWVRIRGVDLVAVADTRAAMVELRAKPYRTCVILRRGGNWRADYLPKDQREAFEQARKLGEAFGDLVDAWEIDNEPDLAFVPEDAERYAAYLKATYLGLKAGIMSARAQARLGSAETRSKEQAAGRVLVGALGLPPGPWFERFVENDGLSYTDGFNYHYYGYAEDFAAVYRQFEAAVQELAREKQAASGTQPDGLRYIGKDLPVFLTEIGNGMLSGDAAKTKGGRLRQWRWFRSVGEQARALRIEAPMAFLLVPYLEYGMYEYGLTVAPEARGGDGRPEAGGGKMGQEKGWTVGGIRYVPEDFGAEEAEPWMDLIGTKIGENEVTPALAWWLGARGAPREVEDASLSLRAAGSEQAKGEIGGSGEEVVASGAGNSPERRRSGPNSGSRSWTVEIAEPSPVVIDFLAGDGLMALKRFGGNFVTGSAPAKAPARQGEEAGAKPLPPMVKPATPPKPPRSEDFIVQIRTQNGNLFEVYPVRTATPHWQTYLEHHDNFTMAFYGRAELPWRFRDNKPMSLVLTFYPKQYPAVYEFRNAELITLGTTKHTEDTKGEQSPARYRFGIGEVVLYNVGEKPVSGELRMPKNLRLANGEWRIASGREGSGEKITLQPMERRVLPVEIKVPGESFERHKAGITFVSDDVPTARFVTEFFPALEGMRREKAESLTLKAEARGNAERIRNLKLASEEAPRRRLENGWFVQDGAVVTEVADGFLVTITGAPAGKVQRLEVEFPWPEETEFPPNGFLSLDYRLRP